MRPSLKQIAVVPVAALALTACGAAGGDPLTPARFRAQANAACRSYNQSLAKVPDAKTLGDIPKVLDQTDPLLSGLISDLKDIDAPKRLAQDYAEFIRRDERSQKTLKQLKDAAAAKDGARLATVARAAQARDRVTSALATRLGLKTCAQS